MLLVYKIVVNKQNILIILSNNCVYFVNFSLQKYYNNSLYHPTHKCDYLACAIINHTILYLFFNYYYLFREIINNCYEKVMKKGLILK